MTTRHRTILLTVAALIALLAVGCLPGGDPAVEGTSASAPAPQPTIAAGSGATPTTPTPSPAATPSPTATAIPSPTPTPTPAAPKVVRIGMSEEPDSVTGYPGGMYGAAVVQNLLFNVLVGVDDQMRPYPDLAETVPTLENGGARWIGEGPSRQLQVTFRLRKGVTWSDGKPLTSRDVRFTWELMLNPDSGSVTDLERKYEKVETPDDHTVVFTLLSEASARAAYARNRNLYADFKDQQGPVVDPLYQFGISGSWIYPEHLLGPLVDNQPRTSRRIRELFTRSEFAQEPVGTGPYVLKEWKPGASLTAKARKDYFKGAPKIETAIFTFVPNTATLIAQLRSGDLDVITQDALDVAAAPELDSLPNARAYYVPGVVWEHLDLNLDHPILRDKSVRKALYHAIDRRAIADAVFEGKSAPLDSVVMPWSWAYGRELPTYDYDPGRAAELLEAAGWMSGPDGIRVKNGAPLALKYVSTDWAPRVKLASLLKEQLRKVGVDLAVEHVPSKTLLDLRTGRLPLRAFEVAEYAWAGSYDPGADALYFWASSSIPSNANNLSGGNYPGYRNPEVDRLLAAGMATLSQEERARIYRQIQRILMDDLPSLPLFYVPNVSAASRKLTGFRPGIGAIGETWNVHEWDLLP